jgi:hypothetical protein
LQKDLDSMLQNMSVSRSPSDQRSGRPAASSRRWRAIRLGSCWLASMVALGVACSDDDGGGGGECIGGEGAVAGAADDHCVADDGSPITQVIGMCVTGGEAAEEGEEHEHEEEEEEEHPTLSGREADDDDCKYRVRFENTCVARGEPVTFTLSLTRKFDGMPGAGTMPAYPEVFLAADPSHISPSNDITAREGPAGTYEIGPIVFDQSGRWVIRFHYFEACSDLPEDSPHGHVAFYIDVP